MALRAPSSTSSAGTLLLLLSGVPKLIRLEEGVGMSSTHAEVLEDFERHLDTVEPTPKRVKAARAAAKKRT